jgi:hypothetical protein
LHSPAGRRRDGVSRPVHDTPAAGPGRTARIAHSDHPIDDTLDDISGGFDDIRYAPVAVNPLKKNKTNRRRR